VQYPYKNLTDPDKWIGGKTIPPAPQKKIMTFVPYCDMPVYTLSACLLPSLSPFCTYITFSSVLSYFALTATTYYFSFINVFSLYISSCLFFRLFLFSPQKTSAGRSFLLHTIHSRKIERKQVKFYGWRRGTKMAQALKMSSAFSRRK
jgi:hypothetical protein